MVQDRVSELEPPYECPSTDSRLIGSISKDLNISCMDPTIRAAPSCSGRDSSPASRVSEMSDSTSSVCSNDNINIDNNSSCDEDEYKKRVIREPLLSPETGSSDESKPEHSNKLIEFQIENVVPVPSVIVPRTVPCIVLTPPTIFNPGLPLLNFSHQQQGRLLSEFGNNNNNYGARTPTSSSMFPSFPIFNHSIVPHHHHHPPHPGDPGNERNAHGGKDEPKSSLDLSQRNNNKDMEKKGRTDSGSPNRNKLAFGIDNILADQRHGASLNLGMEASMGMGHPAEINLKSYHNHHVDHRSSGGGENFSASQCSECFFLSRYCRRIQFPAPTPTSVSPSSFAWIPPPPSTSHPPDSNSALLPSSGYGQHLNLSSYGLSSSNFASMSSMVSCNTSGSGRRKRSWSRAVFSNLQRKGLEKRFQLQKYITKPDRRQLAATLGLTDAQVKVWFQNRRMKWRHSKEGKQGTHMVEEAITITSDKK